MMVCIMCVKLLYFHFGTLSNNKLVLYVCWWILELLAFFFFFSDVQQETEWKGMMCQYMQIWTLPFYQSLFIYLFIFIIIIFFLIFNANLYMKHGICLHRIELLSYLVKLMICPLHHVPNFIDGKHMTFTKLYLMGVQDFE